MKREEDRRRHAEDDRKKQEEERRKRYEETGKYYGAEHDEESDYRHDPYRARRHDPYEYHDIETQEHAYRDEYLTKGYEDEDEDYGEELPCHHTFDDDQELFSERDDIYDNEEVRGMHH